MIWDLINFILVITISSFFYWLGKNHGKKIKTYNLTPDNDYIITIYKK